MNTAVVPYTTPTRAPDRWLADRAPALELAARWADAIAGTDFVPAGLRNNPAAIAAAILYGDEVGLGPMQSLAKIAVINGRPTLAAEAQRALILHAGHDIWVEELTTVRCTIAGRRRDAEATSRITWTIDDAKRAGLAGKQPWRQYPRQMLLARASGELARAVFPDAIGGLAATEELDDYQGALAATAAEANGSDTGTPDKPTTRRRRRASATSNEPEPTPDPAPEPKPDPEPPEPAPPEPGQPANIADNQRRRMMALFREKGIDDRGERLSYARAVTGHDLESSNELTLEEADTVISSLEQFDRDNPQTWPFPEGF